MSFILDQIKDIVKNGIEINFNQNMINGNYQVVVTDKTDSITSGWELVYQVGQSKYNNKSFVPYGHFSELRIKRFSQLFTLIQQTYSQFKQGNGVEKAYDTDFATYQPNENIWITALEKKNGTGITITITDKRSPFHMLSIYFFITMSKQNNQPYMIGYDTQFDQQNDVYTEKINATMLPKKNRYVPIYKQENGVSTIKAQGVLNPQGLVEINEEHTEIVYLQEAGNERKLLASIYEKIIIEKVLEKSDEALQAQQPQQNNWDNSPFNAPFNAFGQTQNNVQQNNNFQQNNTPPTNVFAPFDQALQADTANLF